MVSHEERAAHAETVRMTLTISNCLFWELDAGWVGGGARVIDVWPLEMNITDSQFMNNYALVSSAINYAIYSKSFDEGTGIHGNTRTFLKHVEVAEDQATSIRYTDPTMGRWSNPDDNRLHWGGKRYHQQPMHWVAFGGHWAESENWHLNVDIQDYHTHDIRNSQQAGMTFYNIGRCNCGCLHVSMTDVLVENTKGDFNAQWTSASYLQFGQSAEILRTRFIGNGADIGSMDGAATGVVALKLTDWGRVQNSEFIDGESGSGGAILFESTGWLEIRDSLFRGNSGWNVGGGISHSAVYDPGNPGIPPPGDDGYSLMIINSIFDSNTIPQDQTGKTVELIVYLYTGYTGVGPGQVSGNGDDELLPVWKIDGANPNEIPSPAGCRDPPPQTAWAMRSGEWQDNSPRRYPPEGGASYRVCQDGSVPANETVYGNRSYPIRSFQSEVVRLTVGPHRLWHGVIVNNPFPANDWSDGYIAILGVLPQQPVQVFDNRAQRDDNGIIRQEGCATNPRTNPEDCPPLFDRRDPLYADCVNYCRDGETLWSYTDFEVPYGVGGGINVQAAQKILIEDTIFTNNVAGKGTAVGVAAAEQVTMKNVTYVEADLEGTGGTGPTAKTVALTNPLTQDICTDTPCELGFSCDFSLFSLRCDPCAFNEISDDGISCSQCGPGTEPNADKTECIQCQNGRRSSLGFCEDCEAGTTSSDDRITCVECEQGKIRPADQPECMACEPGKSPSPGKATCAPCYLPGTYSHDGSSCDTCSNGQQPFSNRTGCEPCPAGTSGTDGVCNPCEPGTQPAADKVSCVDCPAETFGRSGLSCESCEPGYEPNAGGGADACVACNPSSISPTGARCTPCPERQTPSGDRTQCFCMAKTYNQVLFGSTTCSGLIESYGSDLEDTCASCPACLTCDDGSTALNAGWAFFGQGEAHECPVSDGCPGGQLLNLTVSRQLWSREEAGMDYSPAALDSQCTEGYAGPICGDCASDFHHLKVGRPCLTCRDGVVDVPALLGAIFGAIVLGGILVSGAYKVLVDHGVVTDLR